MDFLATLSKHQDSFRSLKGSSVYRYCRRQLNAALTSWCYKNTQSQRVFGARSLFHTKMTETRGTVVRPNLDGYVPGPLTHRAQLLSGAAPLPKFAIAVKDC